VTRVRLDDDLAVVTGAKTAKALKTGLGLATVDDLLRHYPRRYLDPGDLTDLDALTIGEHVTVLAQVVSVSTRRVADRGRAPSSSSRRPRTVTQAVISDGRGRLTIVFFNQAWRENQLVPGRRGLFAGTVSAFGGTRQLAHPRYAMLPDDEGGEWQLDDDESATAAPDAAEREAMGRLIIPVYPATGAMPSWRIGQAVRLALDAVSDIDDPIPAQVLDERGFDALDPALRGVHRPMDLSQAERARERLRFEEAFGLQVVLAQRRRALGEMPAIARPPRDDGILASFDARLPFALTAAQRRVGEEIGEDLSRDHPMHRLLQGDVGSGKTLVALRAMLQAVDAGSQAVLLAPTEVLAQQHHRTITSLLGSLADQGLLGGEEQATRVALLTGSQGAARRRRELLDIASGEAGIVVGTHALLEENVEFADLGLVVVDEQHRFGVEQRAVLASRGTGAAGSRGSRPHVLVMTATPIPRTVAMTVFGDLDVSVLDEPPPGRGRISTHVVVPREKPAHLARAWQRVREEVAAGRRVYVVCPRIGDDAPASADEVPDDGVADDGTGQGAGEDRQAAPTSSVIDVVAELRERILPDLRIGMVHGRLPADEKEEALRRFALPATDPDGYDVLVSTTVIEVGVDVPTASTMIVLDADRFGISQLHQLRGRVGRGGDDGLCLLVTNAAEGSAARERLDAVAATTDGFVLARADAEARREGDVLGTSQSGRRRSLRLLEVIRDEDVVLDARDAASAIVDADPDLADMPALRDMVRRIDDDDRAEFLGKG